MNGSVFVPEAIAASGLDLLRGRVECIAPWADGNGLSDEDARSVLRSCDAVIVRLFRIGADDVERSSRLKVIAKHGVGIDNIDVTAAKARGIRIVYTPAANANAVAEHAVTLMTGLARHVEPAARAVREGRFGERGRYLGVELAGKTLGVIGMGRVGTRVAEIAAQGFAMHAVAYDPAIAGPSTVDSVSLVDSAEAVFERCDFLTFHVPLTDKTRHLVNDDSLRSLKADCRIINTSRGAVIDEGALVRALRDGRLAGAALDVFEDEPLAADHPLCLAPNVLLTPHISSSTTEAMDRMARDAAQGVLDVLEGRAPRFPFDAAADP